MSFIFWFINKDRSSHLIRNYESCSLTKSTNGYSGINLTNCSFKKDISTYSRTSHMNCCQKKDINIKIVLFCFFFVLLFTPASILCNSFFIRCVFFFSFCLSFSQKFIYLFFQFSLFFLVLLLKDFHSDFAFESFLKLFFIIFKIFFGIH